MLSPATTMQYLCGTSFFGCAQNSSGRSTPKEAAPASEFLGRRCREYSNRSHPSRRHRLLGETAALVFLHMPEAVRPRRLVMQGLAEPLRKLATLTGANLTATAAFVKTGHHFRCKCRPSAFSRRAVRFPEALRGRTSIADMAALREVRDGLKLTDVSWLLLRDEPSLHAYSTIQHLTADVGPRRPHAQNRPTVERARVSP